MRELRPGAVVIMAVQKVLMKTMKMWIGNLDGIRESLVIAPSKERARKIVGTSRSDFENYWVLQPSIDQGLEFEVLYTRMMGLSGLSGSLWQQGRRPRG